MVFRITRCPMCLGLGVVRFEEFCPTCKGQGTVKRWRADKPAGSFMLDLDKQRVVPIQERSRGVDRWSDTGCDRKSESQIDFHDPRP
jgi:hypothetical protein